ncbi:hypothetical protein BMF94_4204 [Rhodotorula taiwanensis]|uniref:Major facilitator superfamily (MFS) profile domain-containing protein n=1 Tax=Rhodotorula taiwanensis TaxID=741276 RepID=A0A2S5B7R0_9BASI|nr:hypothetical protein BMF94_4204 [Rhodotorula taiwanensis]
MAEEIELAAPRPTLARVDSLAKNPFRTPSSASLADFESFSRSPTPAAQLPDLPSTPPPAQTPPASRRRSEVDLQAEEAGQKMRRMSMGDETGTDGMSLPPIDKGKDAWSFCFAAFILETFIWGFSYTFPSVLVYLESHDPWQKESIASLSAIGTVQLAVMFIFPCTIISFFRRYPDWVRTSLWVSVAVNCLAMLAASWATKVWQLIVLQGVLCGLSGAVLYTPVLLWLNGWFHMKRGLATGIIFSGTGVGGLIFPFLISSALLDKYGFATMCRAWAGITLAVYAIAVYLIKPRVPLRKPRGPRSPWFVMSDFRFLKNPVVIVMTLTSFTSSLAYFPCSLYLPTYTSTLASPVSANIVVAVFNLAASCGSAVIGYTADLSTPITVMASGLAGSLLALTAWGFASSLGAVFAFAVLFGFATQICSTWGPAATDAVGANPHLATLVFCTFGIFRGIASIVGPYISTTLFEPVIAQEHAAWGRFGFRRVIIFVGAMSALSATGGAALHWARKYNARVKAASA